MPPPAHSLTLETVLARARPSLAPPACLTDTLGARSSPSLACEAAGEGWPEAGAGGTSALLSRMHRLTRTLARSSPSLACEAAGEGWPKAGAGGTANARSSTIHNPPPPAILALDLGTHTGWAAWTGASVVSGAWDFTPRRFDGGGMRFLRFQALLRHALDDLRAERVFYEEVRAHAGTDAAHIYGGLWAVLTAHCESRQIPYAGVPVATIKRHATGKGNASKAAMLDAARHRGWNPADDNEADALWLLDAALQGVAT